MVGKGVSGGRGRRRRKDDSPSCVDADTTLLGLFGKRVGEEKAGEGATARRATGGAHSVEWGHGWV